MPEFWAGGRDAHCKAAAAAAKAEVEALRQRMEGASAEEVAALEQEIEAILEALRQQTQPEILYFDSSG